MTSVRLTEPLSNVEDAMLYQANHAGPTTGTASSAAERVSGMQHKALDHGGESKQTAINKGSFTQLGGASAPIKNKGL